MTVYLCIIVIILCNYNNNIALFDIIVIIVCNYNNNKTLFDIIVIIVRNYNNNKHYLIKNCRYIINDVKLHNALATYPCNTSKLCIPDY